MNHPSMSKFMVSKKNSNNKSYFYIKCVKESTFVGTKAANLKCKELIGDILNQLIAEKK